MLLLANMNIFIVGAWAELTLFQQFAATFRHQFNHPTPYRALA
jgi:hypothetical protein